MNLPRPPRAPLRQPRTAALYALIASVAFAIAPHLARAPLWLGAAVACCILWRVVLLATCGRAPNAWWRAALAAALAGLVLLQFQTLFGRVAGSALLIAFAGLKVLETESLRDAMFLNCLSMVVMLSHLLFDQSPVAGLYGAVVVALTIANFGALVSSSRFSVPRALRLTALLLCGGIPLALAAYLLFPRIEGSLWGIPETSSSAATGLAEEMSPGDVNLLSRDDRVAFRAEFEGRQPALSELYWRTLVLDAFDGRTWRRRPSAHSRGGLKVGGRGDLYRYSIALEATQRKWLPVLETPLEVSARGFLSRDATATLSKEARERVNYEGTSIAAAYPADPPERADSRLYANADARVVELARRLGRGARDNEELAERILTMFREREFHYTLRPPLLGVEPVAAFLFETRRGYCEHYASAFATLMRAANAPARVVVGFHGGEFNRRGDYFIVRQSDAHAWAEVWVDGKGWVRKDPTAAVAPQRVELGMDALRRLERAGGLSAGLAIAELRELLRPGWFESGVRDLALLTDAFTYHWNLWVMSYGPQRQRDLLRRLGFETPDSWWMAITLGLVTAAFLPLAYLALNRRGRLPESPLKYYRAFQRKLRRAGVAARPDEGPHHFAQRAASRYPRQRDAILIIGGLYSGLRYGRRADRRTLAELRRRVLAFRPRA